MEDWRIGITVKPKYRGDYYYGVYGVVIGVHPSGYMKLTDDNGILEIKMLSSIPRIIIDIADNWVTA